MSEKRRPYTNEDVFNVELNLSGEDLEAFASDLKLELKHEARQLRPQVSKRSGGGGFKARRLNRIFQIYYRTIFIVLFLLPVFSSAFYYGLLMSRQYESYSNFSLSHSTNALPSLLGGIVSSAGRDQAAQIVDYVESNNIIFDIGFLKEIDTMFGKDKADFLSRVTPSPTLDKALKFWNRRVKISRDGSSERLELRVRAFTAQDSLVLHNKILAAIEKRQSHLKVRQTSRQLEEETELANVWRAEYNDALNQLLVVQKEVGAIDATITANSYETIMNELRIASSSVQQQIEVIREQAPLSPQILPLEARYASLLGQINYYQDLLAGVDATGNNISLAYAQSRLAQKKIDVEFTRSELARSMARVAAVKSEVEHNQTSIELNVSPTLPSDATFPHPLLSWVLVSFAASIAFGMAFGLGVAIKDNMG